MKIEDLLKNASATEFTLDEAAQRLATYLAVAKQANRTYPQLEETWNRVETPVILVYADGEVITNVAGEEPKDQTTKKAVKVRVQGPLDWFWGVDVAYVIRSIEEQNPSSLYAIIDSPGGSLFDGVSLYQYFAELRERGVPVSTRNGGLVASAAVMPFLAGETRNAPKGTSLMTHAPSVAAIVSGEVADIRKKSAQLISRLEHGTSTMAEIYSQCLKCDDKKARSYFASEQWFTAAQAKDEGFATENTETEPANQVTEELRNRARAGIFANMRQEFLGQSH